ncbi:MAG: hypothetical protein AAF611_02805 [Bacteroidota bacterium]
MKKQHLKSLKLRKKSISNLTILTGGADADHGNVAAAAGTCESPCKGGTGCCNGTQTLEVCTYDPKSLSWKYEECICL